MASADVDVVVGLQFGSEGKGGVCQYLLEQSRYQATVRTGGPQAGHSVYLPDGASRAFNVLPAGALVRGVELIIPPGCIIDPRKLEEEIAWCEDRGLEVAGRLRIDQHATLLEEHHPAQERKEGLVARVGGTGRGVTAATSDRLWRRARLARDEPALAGFCVDTTELLSGLGPILVEMTQGYGLSLYTAAAFFPYLTSREISTAQGLAESGLSPRRLRHVYGVARTFPIRAGLDSGPLGGEMPFADLGVEPEFATTTGRPRRIGGWDAWLARRAVKVCGVDRVVLTHVDYLDRSLYGCRDMAVIRQAVGDSLDSMERGLGAPVTLLSTAPATFTEVGGPVGTGKARTPHADATGPGDDEGTRIVALSGLIGSGKTTLARRLADRTGACHLRSNQILRSYAVREGLGDVRERAALQRYSAALDSLTKGAWLAEGLAPEVARLPGGVLVIVDAIRLPEQLAALRTVFGSAVGHVHLVAPGPTLEQRYRQRETEFVELPCYAEVLADSTEAAVPAMADCADLVIDTGKLTPDDVEAVFLRWLASAGGQLSDPA